MSIKLQTAEEDKIITSTKSNEHLFLVLDMYESVVEDQEKVNASGSGGTRSARHQFTTDFYPVRQTLRNRGLRLDFSLPFLARELSHLIIISHDSFDLARQLYN